MESFARRFQLHNLKTLSLSQVDLRVKRSRSKSPSKSLCLSSQASVDSQPLTASSSTESSKLGTSWNESLHSSIQDLHKIHQDVLLAEEELAMVLRLQKESKNTANPDLRKIHKSFVRVDMAKRKLKDTLENVERQWNDHEGNIFQRAGDLHKDSESRFSKMKVKQKSADEEMLMSLEKEMVLAKACLTPKLNAKHCN